MRNIGELTGTEYQVVLETAKALEAEVTSLLEE